jgi:hypothetical protein
MRHLRVLYVRVLRVRTNDAYRSNPKFAELTKVLVLELEMSPFEARRNNVKISTKGTRGRAFRTLGYSDSLTRRTTEERSTANLRRADNHSLYRSDKDDFFI